MTGCSSQTGGLPAFHSSESIKAMGSRRRSSFGGARIRWLARLLRPHPGRHEWAAISQRIATGFENARQEWFDVCVKQLGSCVRGSDTPATELNAKLDGDVVLNIKAYQLGSISGFLASQEYVRKSVGKDFRDLFWAQVGGAELPSIVVRIHEFMRALPESAGFSPRSLGAAATLRLHRSTNTSMHSQRHTRP
jgi:hypothetical protein